MECDYCATNRIDESAGQLEQSHLNKKRPGTIQRHALGQTGGRTELNEEKDFGC